MKTKLLYTLALLCLITFLVFIQGCEEEDGVTVEERVDSFLDDLNNDTDRDTIYLNLHSNIQATWADPTQWLGSVFRYAYAPFDFESMTYGSNSATGTLSCSPTGPNGASMTISLSTEDGDYYITPVTLNSSSVF